MKLIVVLMLIALTVPAFAEKGDLLIDSQVVMRIRFPAAGMSIQERVDRITDRVNLLLGSDEFYPEKLAIQKIGNDVVIVYTDKLIVTVDLKTARANKTTSQRQATQWRDNLRRVVPDAKALDKGVPSL